MEKDHLEKFIHDHREDFDVDRPSFKVWADIERSLDKDQKKQSFKKYWFLGIAASIALVLGLGLGILVYPQWHEYQSMQSISANTELQAMEQYYAREVSMRFEELSGDRSLEDINPELKMIDANIEQLKEDLIDAPRSSREEILTAIITSYMAKVDLLEKAIEIKETIKNYDTEI